MLGNALAGLRDYDNAASVTRRALELSPERGGVYGNLGTLELARGDRDQAERAFAEAIQKNPRVAGAWLAQGNFYRAIGAFEKADTALLQAVTLEPENPRANRALASHFLDTNRPERAEPYLRRVAEAQKDVGSWMDLVDLFIAMHRYDDARTLLAQVAKEHPGFEVSSRLALAEHAAGRIQEAHDTLTAFLQTKPNHAGALTLEARLLLEEERVQDALDRARSALQADPQAAEAHFVMGLIQQARQSPEDARKSFVEVLTLDPSSTEARLELARLHASRGELDTAIGYATESVRVEPANLKARLVLAQTLTVREEDRPKALEIIQTLLKNYPASPVVHTALGSYHLSGNQRAAARRAFEQALQLDPMHLEALASLMALDLAENAPARAWSRIHARLKDRPRDPDLMMVAAKFAMAVGDRRAAEQYLRRSMAAAPAALEPYAILGQLFVAEGRLSDAIREFREVIRRDPNSVAAHTMLGLLLHTQRNTADAVVHYQRAVNLDRGAAAAANNLAWLYAENEQNLDEALQLAQAAKNKLPNSPQISDTLGWVYYKKGMLPLAITAFEHSVERDPKNPIYHYHLGLAYAKSGEDSRARVALQRALAIAPSFARAGDARKVLASLVY